MEVESPGATPSTELSKMSNKVNKISRERLPI